MNSTNPILLTLLAIILFVLGFLLGRMSVTNETVKSMGDSVADTMDTMSGESTTDTSANADAGTKVDASTMTAGQRQMLETMGVNPDNVSITPEMVACAEAKLGVARVAEIRGGATPSMSEGVTLMGCYTSS